MPNAKRAAFPRLAVVFGSMAIAVSASPAWAAQQLASWDGGAGTPNWGDALNWSADVVPNNGIPAGTTYAVVIDDGSGGGGFMVDLDVDVFIDSLTVGSGDRLNVNDGQMITVVNSGSGTGAIVNAGLIALDSFGAFTTLRISGGPVILSGGGAVQMSDSTSNRIQGVVATDHLINVDNTIFGAGQIGLGSMGFNNHGTVLANQSNPLFINPSLSPPVINTGTIRASGGALLVLGGGTYANDGGVIEIDSGGAGSDLVAVGATIAGGTVQLTGPGPGELFLDNTIIVGGTVTNSSTGLIQAVQGTSRLGGTVTNPAGGRITVANAVELVLEAAGTYLNSGTIRLDSVGGITTLRVAGGTVTLSGGGVVQMSNTPSNRILGMAPSDHLFNLNNVIVGAGQIGQNFMNFTNQGTLLAIGSNSLTLDTTDGAFHNMGTVQVDAASTLTLGSGDTYAQTSGTTLVDGMLAADEPVDIVGGSLRGTGTIFSPAVLNGGQVAPGTSPGLLSVAGSYYSQSAATVLTIEIGGATVGAQYDRLAVAVTASLGGSLDVSLINGFTPAAGQVFTILTAASILGTFAGLSDGAHLFMPDGTIFVVHYTPAGAPTSVTLTASACPTPVVVVPDGRLTTRNLGAGAEAWFGASVRIGNSYSVEFKNTSGDSTPPGTLTLFSGDDGCSGNSTVAFNDTASNDPAAGAARRQSFTAMGTGTFFRAKLDNGAGPSMPISFTWSDTTLFSPAWSTNASFDTYYSFQNTTGGPIDATLTLLDSSGTVLSTFPVSVPAGQTASLNTASLGVSRNQTGTAKLSHDGPPGSVLAEAVIANFSISPAYVQPVKFQGVRDGR